MSYALYKCCLISHMNHMNTYTLHKMPLLCMNCKHFSYRSGDVMNGICLRHVKINVVHGRLEQMYADEAREVACIGAKDFEQNIKLYDH